MEVTCTHCGQAFTVPATMKGGIANCPDCRRAVELPGRSEGMYWALIGLGLVGVVAAGGIGFALGGPAVGGTVLARARVPVLSRIRRLERYVFTQSRDGARTQNWRLC